MVPLAPKLKVITYHFISYRRLGCRQPGWNSEYLHSRSKVDQLTRSFVATEHMALTWCVWICTLRLSNAWFSNSGEAEPFLNISKFAVSWRVCLATRELFWSVHSLPTLRKSSDMLRLRKRGRNADQFLISSVARDTKLANSCESCRITSSLAVGIQVDPVVKVRLFRIVVCVSLDRFPSVAKALTVPEL